MSQDIMLIELSIQAGDHNAEEAALQSELARINNELARCTSQASKEDYAIAIGCGILAGTIDALFVGETPVFGADTEEAIGKAHERVNRFIQDYASAHGYKGERLKGAIEHLEEKFPVAQDNIWKGTIDYVSAKDHHLADLAHHPTPAGLAAAIIVRFLRVGIFVGRDGTWHLQKVETSREELIELLVPAVASGFLNWLAMLAETAYEIEAEEEVPKAIKRLALLVANMPMLVEIAKCADNWFGHLVSDMGGSKDTPGGGMGIPGVILSLLYEIAALPGIKNTGLLNDLDQLYVKGKIDLRHELVAYGALGKQAVPVILNEVLVRMAFFVSRLADKLAQSNSLVGISWPEIMPIGNRTVDRMMTVASLTLSLADSADAAVHACLESAGNKILAIQRFSVRYNYVATGRVAIAIVKEVQGDAREIQLLREKRLLLETKATLSVKKLEEYMDALDTRLDEYLSEDLTAFFEGFQLMDKGLVDGNSNMVIAGNVIIQEVLGKQPQFTSQAEFDDLMGSDEDFVL